MILPFLFSSLPGAWRRCCWLLLAGLGWLISLPAQAQAPVLSSFAPASGVAGTAVTLTGSNLAGVTSVSFNGTAAAAYTLNSATSLTAVVPAGATTGPVRVTATSGAATSASNFGVLQPSTRAAIVMDGYREALYGAPLAVQANPTGFGNATNNSPTTSLNGSELDAAYAYVSGDSLHVFLAGNQENNYNALAIFFDAKPGGRTIINQLGAAGSPYNNLIGLTFDPGFAADYVLEINNDGLTSNAQFGDLAANTISNFATGTSRSVPVPVGNYTARVGLDQSNTGGVDGTAVYGAAPAGVVTGVEFVLPLAALGRPTGSLKIMAFLANQQQDYLSNQTLAALPAGTPNLAGPPSALNFSNYAGNQYFTVPLPASSGGISITSFSPASGPVGSTVTITGSGFTGATAVGFNGAAATYLINAAGTQIGATVPAGATTGPISVFTPQGSATTTTSYTVLLNSPVISSFAPASGVAGTEVTITGTDLGGTTAVQFNGVSAASFVVNSPTSVKAVVPVGAGSGTISLTTPQGTGASNVFLVDVPRASRLLVDGYREARYGTAQVVQTTPTGFGNATTGNTFTATGGSELDAAYTYVHGDSLYVFLAGNIESNGNQVEVFFDSQAGGQNVLAGNNPNVDGNGLNALAGLAFDQGFTADYYLSLLIMIFNINLFL